MIGVDRTTFFPTAQNVTKAMDLTIVPDQAPEQGSYYRSDHFSLAKAGVPAFSIKQGCEVDGKPAGWGQAKSKEYREKHYHQAERRVRSDVGLRRRRAGGAARVLARLRSRATPRRCRCGCRARSSTTKTAAVRQVARCVLRWPLSGVGLTR